MLKEMTMDELMMIDGGGSLGGLIVAGTMGAVSGAVQGGAAGSLVPGGGTVVGALAGAIIGGGIGMLTYAVQDCVATKIDDRYDRRR